MTKKDKKTDQGKVAVIMGSDSDFPVMKDACDILTDLGVAFDTKVVSAHRTPELMAEFAKSASANGYCVIIAGAGGAAHLPGMVAAHSELPVIGVPVPHGPLQGEDALLSIVQMPKGVPVATVAIGNSYNAGILAAQIMAFGGRGQPDLADRIRAFKEKMRITSTAKKVSYKKSK